MCLRMRARVCVCTCVRVCLFVCVCSLAPERVYKWRYLRRSVCIYIKVYNTSTMHDMCVCAPHISQSQQQRHECVYKLRTNEICNIGSCGTHFSWPFCSLNFFGGFLLLGGNNLGDGELAVFCAHFDDWRWRWWCL